MNILTLTGDKEDVSHWRRVFNGEFDSSTHPNSMDRDSDEYSAENSDEEGGVRLDAETEHLTEDQYIED